MLKGKRQVVYVMLITAVFFYSCEKEVSSDMVVERNGLTYEVNSEIPFSGKAVEFFEGGEVKSKSTSYKDGKLDGVFRTWFENGQISSEDSYKDGSVTLSKLWRENGHQLAETSWKADKVNGIVKFWYENGQLKSEESYIDDERQGLKKVWYENGQQQFEGAFIAGQLNGKIQEWHENGVPKREGKLLEGKKDGLWTFWNRNGEKSKELEYENGLLTNTILFQAVADVDGNVYETIKIGDQVWMAENLKVSHYRNGDPIPNLTSSVNWKNTRSGALCFYKNSDKGGNMFGALYNWYAVEDSRNIAPDGWHIPTDDEWTQLEMYLGMSQAEADESQFRGTNEGSKLAGNDSLWFDGALKDEKEFGASGFTVLPGGYRLSETGEFGGIAGSGSFWTSSYFDRLWESAYYRLIFYNDARSRGEANDMKMGLSVRCVKD